MDDGEADLLHDDEVTFLICVEANRLEPQALMLCESLRRFGGRYRAAPILAVSPRPHLAPGARVRDALADLGVTHVVEPLNRTGSAYGTINRVVAGGWAEAHSSSPYLVVLDTDTVFVDEPRFLRHDAGVRPVDVKGIASAGPNDPLDAYWTAVCGFAGLRPSDLPMVQTTVDGERVRAVYNGGLTVVRRDRGVLAAAAEVFFAAFTRDLRPPRAAPDMVLASTGFVDSDASSWWGSSQAALSAGIWSRTRDVVTYDRAYNIPVHSMGDAALATRLVPESAPVLLHYHYLAEAPYQQALREAVRRLGCSAAAEAFVDTQLPRFLAEMDLSTR